MKLQTPVLVTGASGFVGANLLRRLIVEGSPKAIHLFLRKRSNLWRIQNTLKKVSVHVIDMRSASKVDRLIRTIRPKTIFHLATHGAYPSEQYDEEEIVSTNVQATFHLMRSCLAAGCEAFINTGSSSEYGAKQKPMKEGDVLAPVTAYGVSKAWATLYGQYLAVAHGAPVVTLRPFSVYGPYEPAGRLIPNIILALLKNEPPKLSSPRTARDFVFVDDMVDAYLRAARNPRAGTIFNIGSGRQITLAEVFSHLKNIMKLRVEPMWDGRMARSFDTNRWVADTSFTAKRLQWKPSIPLIDGLRRTLNWFRHNLHLYQK